MHPHLPSHMHPQVYSYPYTHAITHTQKPNTYPLNAFTCAPHTWFIAWTLQSCVFTSGFWFGKKGRGETTFPSVWFNSKFSWYFFLCVWHTPVHTLSRWNLGTKRTSRVWVTVRNLKGAMCPVRHPLDWCWIPRPCCYRSHFSLRSRFDTWCESHSNGE